MGLGSICNLGRVWWEQLTTLLGSGSYGEAWRLGWKSSEDVSWWTLVAGPLVGLSEGTSSADLSMGPRFSHRLVAGFPSMSWERERQREREVSIRQKLSLFNGLAALDISSHHCCHILLVGQRCQKLQSWFKRRELRPHFSNWEASRFWRV